MTIAIVTRHPDNPYAAGVLRALNAQGARAIHLIAETWSSQPRDLASLVRKHGVRLPWVAVTSVARKIGRALGGVVRRGGQTTTLAAEVKTQGGRFVLVDDANGESCREALTALGVDIVVLAGAPIMRPPVLSVPRIGTLNAHQGALPRYRGMNVIEWAIFERSAPSITVHFVDPGIDTGDVVASEEIEVRPGDTLEAVRARAMGQQVQLLARTVRSACAGPLPRLRQLAGDGRQYYTMHPRLRALSERRLSAVSARRVAAASR